MSVEDQLTLAELDYEMHAGSWPIGRDVTTAYIAVAHPSRSVDRHLLIDVLAEYIGSFDTMSELAKTLTAQSFLGESNVDLNGWPFAHIDWEAAGATLEGSIAEDTAGPIMRVHGRHYFAPDAVL